MRATHLALPAALLLLSCGAGRSAPPPPAPRGHPVAVELFTAQGCSSCPPADAILAKLASDLGVVAISRPVTYWDSLGWKDSFALPLNTDLQRGYTARGIPGGGTYTPEAVVQGRYAVVGGNEAQLRRSIAEAAALPEPGLAIAPGADGGRNVTLSGTPGGAGARLSVAALRRTASVDVGRGENGGRRLSYADVLIGETDAGNWNGGTLRIAVPAAALHVPGADRYALLVREGASGNILAARYL